MLEATSRLARTSDKLARSNQDATRGVGKPRLDDDASPALGAVVVLLADTTAAAVDDATKSRIYRPEPVPTEAVTLDWGTKIVLTRLKKNPSKTVPFLKRRLARRFSLLGDNFELKINDNVVSGVAAVFTATDRDLYRMARYLWVYGSNEYVNQCKKKTASDLVVEQRPSILYKGTNCSAESDRPTPDQAHPPSARPCRCPAAQQTNRPPGRCPRSTLATAAPRRPAAPTRDTRPRRPR